MPPPFPVKDIALQAGLSVATVDRVLHGRPHVRAHTAQRVQQAIAALQTQSHQLGLAGRKLMLDLVMEAPERFARAVRQALEDEMAQFARCGPGAPPLVLRARYALAEHWRPAELVAQLAAIGRRGSHGVLLKAPDLPEVTAAVDALAARGIPVLTLATDLPHSARIAYVGLDNRAAGATAAYLMAQWLGAARQVELLVSLSSVRFEAEATRADAFRSELLRLRPRWRIHDVSEGLGTHARTAALVARCLQQHAGIGAVYSVGGANAAILQTFAQAGRRCRCFIAHDLDEDNRALLRSGQLSAVLHHDLRHDMRNACQRLMAACSGDGDSAGLAPPDAPGLSNIVVVTPRDLPA